MLRPRDFVKYGESTSGYRQRLANVFLCYDDAHFTSLARELGRSGWVRKRTRNLLFLNDGQTALVGRFGIGAPAVVAQCEELIALGAKRFVSLGTAASISKSVEIGDVIVCERAFSDEGTSRHYQANRQVFFASKGLARRFQTWLCNLPCKLGTAWTTDAPYRETKTKRDAFIAKGADVVEMEASAFYMVARFRNVEALAVFVVGDSIAGSKWEPHFNDKPVRLRLNRTGRVLLDFLRSRAWSGGPGVDLVTAKKTGGPKPAMRLNCLKP